MRHAMQLCVASCVEHVSHIAEKVSTQLITILQRTCMRVWFYVHLQVCVSIAVIVVCYK